MGILEWFVKGTETYKKLLKKHEELQKKAGDLEQKNKAMEIVLKGTTNIEEALVSYLSRISGIPINEVYVSLKEIIENQKQILKNQEREIKILEDYIKQNNELFDNIAKQEQIFRTVAKPYLNRSREILSKLGKGKDYSKLEKLLATKLICSLNVISGDYVIKKDFDILDTCMFKNNNLEDYLKDKKRPIVLLKEVIFEKSNQNNLPKQYNIEKIIAISSAVVDIELFTKQNYKLKGEIKKIFSKEHNNTADKAIVYLIKMAEKANNGIKEIINYWKEQDNKIGIIFRNKKEIRIYSFDKELLNILANLKNL